MELPKKVKLFAVKVLGDEGSGPTSGIIAGIDFVIQQKLKDKKPTVANMSLGGGKSTALNLAVKKAAQNNVIFVVAAGNDNKDACNYSPASAPEAITVGATDVGDVQEEQVDIRSYYSNFGTCVDIFGQGSAIKAAWIGGVNAVHTISGTSMASPHLCEMAAVIVGNDPHMNWSQVKNQLSSDASADMIDLQCAGSVDCLKSPNLLAYNGCNA